MSMVEERVGLGDTLEIVVRTKDGKIKETRIIDSNNEKEEENPFKAWLERTLRALLEE